MDINGPMERAASKLPKEKLFKKIETIENFRKIQKELYNGPDFKSIKNLVSKTPTTVGMECYITRKFNIFGYEDQYCLGIFEKIPEDKYAKEISIYISMFSDYWYVVRINRTSQINGESKELTYKCDTKQGIAQLLLEFRDIEENEWIFALRPGEIPRAEDVNLGNLYDDLFDL